MSSEDEDTNLTVVAQPQTTAASVASPAVASSSQPLGLDLSLSSSMPLGSDLCLGLPGSKPLGSDLSLGQLGSLLPPLGSLLPVAQPQTTTASVASLAVASSSQPLGLDLSLSSSMPLGSEPGSKPIGLDLSLGQLGFTLLATLSQTTAASAASPAIASSSRGPRALNFPFTKIRIGDWTQDTASSGDLMAKCFFGKRQLVWELLVEVQKEDKTKKLFKKMEIHWASILSLEASEGILEVELREPPKFFIENDDPLTDTKWIPIKYFTQNHPSSIYRRHELHFDPKVLETNINKIVASDIFWSTLAPYPSITETTFFVASGGDQDASRKRKEREE